MTLPQIAAQHVRNTLPIKILLTDASFSESNEIARGMNSRLPTFSEFIRALKDDPGLYERARGDWYWVGNESGFNLQGYHRINYEKGSVSFVSERDRRIIPTRELAYIWKCEKPLMMLIRNVGESRRLDIGDGNAEPGEPVFVAVIDTSHVEKILTPGRAALERLKRGIGQRED